MMKGEICVSHVYPETGGCVLCTCTYSVLMSHYRWLFSAAHCNLGLLSLKYAAGSFMIHLRLFPTLSHPVGQMLPNCPVRIQTKHLQFSTEL